MTECHKTTLANGLRIVAAEMPHLHSAEIAVYLKVGGRDETREKAGISHFLEHMLFRGTSEHPTSLELETAFERIGGNINAATDAETTCFYSRVHPDHVAEGLRLLSVMLRHPTFPGSNIEKRIITEEALEDFSEDGEEINTDNLASSLLWPDHPLGMPTIGYLDTIEGFTVDDLRVHLATYYVPSNAVVVAAGRITASTVFAAATEAFGDWSGPEAPPSLRAIPNQEAPQSIFVKDADSQVDLQIAFRSFARDDSRIMATRLIRRILCGGGSSRLHLLLREQLGIVYSVDALLSAYDETGCFAIELSTAPENLRLAVEHVLREVLRLATEPIPLDELNRIKQGYFFDLEYSRDSTFEMQVRYGWGEVLGMVRTIEDDQAEAALISVSDISLAARALFSPANLNLVAVGPQGESYKDDVKTILAEYSAAFAKLDTTAPAPRPVP